MTNHQNRFSSRVENYVKYRPGYPAEILDILKSECGLRESSVIADVGSGTGILSELFLRNGNRVYGVEPNAPMRLAAEQLLSSFPEFISVAGAAEATQLESQSIDLITAGQAFHWFDWPTAKTEFKRILKPGGWVALIWNQRLVDSTPFLCDYESLLLQYGTDYQEIRHENAATHIAGFFEPEGFEVKSLKNFQHFDFDGLKGRLLSASYVPESGHPDFEPMLCSLEKLFDLYSSENTVTVEYETKLYYGQLGR